jgi:hypothetical protein
MLINMVKNFITAFADKVHWFIVPGCKNVQEKDEKYCAAPVPSFSGEGMRARLKMVDFYEDYYQHNPRLPGVRVYARAESA